MSSLPLSVRIQRELDKLCRRMNADEGSKNASPLFGDAFFYQVVESRASAQRKNIWNTLHKKELVRDEAGVIGDTPNYIATLTVRAPSFRIDEDALVQRLVDDFKLKITAAKQLIEDCKQPTKAPRTYKVAEKD